LSTSVAFAVKVTSLPLGVQVEELVPGGQGRTIELIEVVTALTTGG
jgi:hypothetical protein